GRCLRVMMRGQGEVICVSLYQRKLQRGHADQQPVGRVGCESHGRVTGGGTHVGQEGRATLFHTLML
ncbi:hypothetical protein, partial [Escherichia coli]|uniref:hypothetical protein n=1 Tax=Escherichia coli TaxID=562 RepID=UPI001BB21E16